MNECTVAQEEEHQDRLTGMTAAEEQDYLSELRRGYRVIFGDPELLQCLNDTTLDAQQTEFLSELFSGASEEEQDIFITLWAEQLNTTAEELIKN